ncbi:MAG: hypothetical protein LBT79_00575, partial [Elusimicrobiota bacterium]|nr:hypothetical protein [Elusimicrobiota bacterium]
LDAINDLYADMWGGAFAQRQTNTEKLREAAAYKANENAIESENFKKWFGDWQTLQRIKAVKEINSKEYKLNAPMTQKDVENAFRSFGYITNKFIGKTRFPVQTVGKIIKHKGFPIEQITEHLPEIYQNALFAFSGNEKQQANHKPHNNIELWHNLVNKFKIKNANGKYEEYYIRFTVQEMKAPKNKQTDAEKLLHSTFISDVSIYKASDAHINSGTIPTIATPLTDHILEKWFNSVNEDDISKVVDENGKPKKLQNDNIFLYDGYGANGINEYRFRDSHVSPSSSDLSLSDIQKGVLENDDISLPADFFTERGVKIYGTGEYSEKSYKAISEVLNNKRKRTIKAYRTVPKYVPHTQLQNSDWITFSKDYAVNHGERRFDGEYKIIEQDIPISDVYFDGNDINEWGYNDGSDTKPQHYVSIKNPKYAEIPKSNQEIYKIKDEGYDGVIDGDKYFVMNKSQIKSIDNRGTFDENNPNIYYRLDQPHAETKETTPADRVISKTEKADIKLFNHKAGIENLAKRAKEAGLKAGAQIGIKSRNIAGLAGRVASTLNSNTFLIDKDGNIKITGEGLKTIIEDARKTLGEKDALKLQTDLNDYMIAKRYLDDLANRNDVYVSMEQADWAKKAISDMRKDYKNMDAVNDIAKRIYDFQFRVLYNYVDSGVISQEQFDDIKKLNPHYVPFQRITNYLEHSDGKLLNKKGLYTIEGSDKAVKNVFESIVENTGKLLSFAYNNDLTRDIAHLAAHFPDQVKISDNASGENTFSYFENGKKQYVAVDDAVAAGLKGLPKKDWGKILGVVIKSSDILRAGSTTFSLRFLLRNPIRDSLEAYVFGNKGFIPLLHSIKSIKNIVKKDADYQAFLQSGGSFGSFMDMSEANLYKMANNIFSVKSKFENGNRWKYIYENSLKRIERLNEIMEQATRVAVFKAAKKRGLSDLEAGFEAREATLDFARMGTMVIEANRF